jgi:hypothetical protein
MHVCTSLPAIRDGREIVYIGLRVRCSMVRDFRGQSKLRLILNLIYRLYIVSHAPRNFNDEQLSPTTK